VSCLNYVACIYVLYLRYGPRYVKFDFKSQNLSKMVCLIWIILKQSDFFEGFDDTVIYCDLISNVE